MYFDIKCFLWTCLIFIHSFYHIRIKSFTKWRLCENQCLYIRCVSFFLMNSVVFKQDWNYIVTSIVFTDIFFFKQRDIVCYLVGTTPSFKHRFCFIAHFRAAKISEQNLRFHVSGFSFTAAVNDSNESIISNIVNKGTLTHINGLLNMVSTNVCYFNTDHLMLQ